MNTSQGGRAHLYMLTSHDREVGTGHSGEARMQNPRKMRRKVRVSGLQPRSFTGRKQEDPTCSARKGSLNPRPQLTQHRCRFSSQPGVCPGRLGLRPVSARGTRGSRPSDHSVPRAKGRQGAQQSQRDPGGPAGKGAPPLPT